MVSSGQLGWLRGALALATCMFLVGGCTGIATRTQTHNKSTRPTKATVLTFLNRAAITFNGIERASFGYSGNRLIGRLMINHSASTADICALKSMASTAITDLPKSERPREVILVDMENTVLSSRCTKLS